MLCAAGTLQPPVFMPGEEATLFRVEAVQESETLVDGDVAGIGGEFQLLAEDIMQEVEVVADEEQEQWSIQELEEKMVEKQGQDRPGGLSEHLGARCPAGTGHPAGGTELWVWATP